MIWIVRRLLVPFAVGSAVSIVLLLIWALWMDDSGVSFRIHDFALAAGFVLPFQLVGFALLVPIALLLCNLPLPKSAYPALLATVGAALGITVVLPISDEPNFLDLTLLATCGALSALVWFAFNRDAIKRHT